MALTPEQVIAMTPRDASQEYLVTMLCLNELGLDDYLLQSDVDELNEQLYQARMELMDEFVAMLRGRERKMHERDEG
jgi:hypothetical protein